ncbi:GrpB family protein [Sporolactobacillus sp. STCC-11]|uniref:GrpB family protein n=1 Tax=Sporolactobacillus caesalpiniae TaxID=3230362 RepID=UPI0033950B53
MAQREIQVVPYNEEWAESYKREALRVAHVLTPVLQAIHHVGSTSIPGIFAKPTIDILAEVNDLNAVDLLNSSLSKLNYRALGENGIHQRRYFVKEDGQGRHLFHLHIFVVDTDNVVRHLAFRDYLRTHDEDAAFYSTLKCQLAQQFPDDRESYCAGKNELCKRIEQIALQWWYDA